MVTRARRRMLQDMEYALGDEEFVSEMFGRLRHR
jgi:hypothetical protein